MHTALILVDIQNDFLPGGALAVPGGDEVIPIANFLTPHFDLVVATQDWHPRDHVSFAANHAGRSPGEVINVGGQAQVLWPVHCVQDTHGAQFPASLDTSRIARLFRSKGSHPEVDSYSGFYDHQRRHSTGLEAFLRTTGIKKLYLMGLATDYCVRATALDAVSLGFQTDVIEDGCRAVDLRSGDGLQALAAMRDAGVRLVRSDAVLAHARI